MKTSSLVAAFVAIIVVAGAVWYFMQPAANTQAPVANLNTNPAQPSDTGVNASATATVGTPQSVTVHYNGTSFTPASVTVHQGDTVTFVADSGQMWVASAPHPTHTAYDGTTEAVHCAAGYAGPKPFDECGAGASFSFTFDKAGSFKYHNHFNTGAFGTVVVQ